MGYRTCAIALLGVELDHGESLRLMEALEAKMAASGHSGSFGIAEALVALGYAAGTHEPVWRGEGADSRIHETEMFSRKDRLGRYALGLEIAYGSEESAEALAKAMRPDWIDEFDEGIGAMLFDLMGWDAQPQGLLVVQTH